MVTITYAWNGISAWNFMLVESFFFPLYMVLLNGYIERLLHLGSTLSACFGFWLFLFRVDGGSCSFCDMSCLAVIFSPKC